MSFPIRQCCQISQEGLWNSNVALKQLLGLCPLLAVSATVVNSLGLGLATLFTLIVSNLLISTLRHWIPSEIRLPIFVLIIASVVTIVELLMHAYFPELHRILGIFIPLIVTNCAIIGRAEAFASKQKVGFALMDGITMGLGFTLVLVLLGGLREIISQGTLFADAQLLFGSAAAQLKVTLTNDYGGFLLAALPPGAFIGLGLLVALKNSIDDWLTQRRLKTQTLSNIHQAIQTSVDHVS
ncbi:electron transport complex subunit E [Candidatus Nitrosacidococcus tergens]|uniref:Ion-translocating oxidoreductase complex subunit E n=1 Tax=Candidatus Nitrosacidococcus tergens TaxID=553981 RepID=A0A7G1Q992_9GAMM|nr:electron transport complex subunit E [Candidatus Nitrosacidococcus tergens]CAB1275765.1 putative inner membrane NADH-quinone reductase [Candidatus Nitrosacidococcus tergens]